MWMALRIRHVGSEASSPLGSESVPSPLLSGYLSPPLSPSLLVLEALGATSCSFEGRQRCALSTAASCRRRAPIGPRAFPQNPQPWIPLLQRESQVASSGRKNTAAFLTYAASSSASTRLTS